MRCDGCRKEITNRIWSVTDGSDEYCDDACYEKYKKPSYTPSGIWLAAKPEEFVCGVFGDTYSV